MEDCLYTVKEIAKVLKTNTDAVYKLMNDGELPYLVLGSRKVRRGTLENFLEERERQTMKKADFKHSYDVDNMILKDLREIKPKRRQVEKDNSKKMLNIVTINGKSLYNDKV